MASPHDDATSRKSPDDTVRLSIKTIRSRRKEYNRMKADIDPEMSQDDLLELILDLYERNPALFERRYR